MRFTLRSTCFLAVVLYHVKFSFETESSHRPKKSVISRRAIDGTRGRKYYDPVEDGFFDDYSYEGGQYDANQDTLGEPGVDYPAYQRLPQTSFSCEGRPRGYYADEEAGCQLFHVCDDILVSSFLCPVGSIFSQKLLTCDWWNKVDCSLTRKFYEANRDIYDQDDDEMLRKAYAMTGLRVSYNRKDQGKDGNLVTYVTFDRNGNDLPNNYDDILVDPDYNTYPADYRNEADKRYHGHVLYSQEYRTKAPKIHEDSPIVRIHKITDNHHTAYKQPSEMHGNIDTQKQPINSFESEFQPSYAPTVPTVTTTTRRYYSPTVPMMFSTTTPSYSKRDQYTHRIESQITPTVPTVFFGQNSFFSTPPNPIGQVRNVDVTNYSEKKREDKNEDYGQEFGEDMEVRESIGLAQSKDERIKGTAEKVQSIKKGDKIVNATKIVSNNRLENVSTIVEGNDIRNISLIGKQIDGIQLNRYERTSTVSPSSNEQDDIVVQHHSTKGWNLLTSTIKPRTTTRSPTNHKHSESSTYQPFLENVSKPSEILVPPEIDLGFNVRVPVTFFDEEHLPHISSQSESSRSTIEYNPQTSPSRTAIGFFDQVQNTSDAETTYFDGFTTPSPLPVSHLPDIKIPATEIVPPYDHLYAGGYVGTYPTTDSEYDGVTEINPFYYETTISPSNSTNDTIYDSTKDDVPTPQMPLIELEPPVYNHKDEYATCCDDIKDNKTSSEYVTSTSKPSSFSLTSEGTKLDNIQEYTEVDVVKPKDNYSDHEALDYVESFKSPDYAQEEDYSYSTSDDQTETTTEFDGTHRILSLLQIMVELAKTNRFPRPFTHNEPLTINVMSTTPPSEDNSHIAHFAQNNSNSGQYNKRQDEDLDYPVYRREEDSDDSLKTTIVTTSPESTDNETSNKPGLEVTTLMSDLSVEKEIVETEMVSSLGFTLSTEEGRHEFIDAVRRGLISEKFDELPSSTESLMTEKSNVTEA